MRVRVTAACLSVATRAAKNDDMPEGTTFPDDDWMTQPMPDPAGDAWSDREHERIMQQMEALRDAFPPKQQEQDPRPGTLRLRGPE